MDPVGGTPPRQPARIAGALYLINIVLGAFALASFPPSWCWPAMRQPLHTSSRRTNCSTGSASLDGVVTVTNVPLALIFYELFKVVNRKLALLDAFFILVATAIEAAGLLNRFAGRGKTGAAGRNQPATSASAPGEKPSHERRVGLLTVCTTRGFLLVQIGMFLVLATIHFGLLIDDYRRAAAGTTEVVITVLLLFGLLLTWRPPPWSRRAGTAEQSFATLGVLVGLFTFALGIGPRTIVDLSLNGIMPRRRFRLPRQVQSILATVTYQ
jgi:Domain of unknown function (DUF4386)